MSYIRPFENGPAALFEDRSVAVVPEQLGEGVNMARLQEALAGLDAPEKPVQRRISETFSS
jgi:hypothetical protein